MEKIRIVFVDDEPLVLETIVSMVDWEGGVCELAGTAANGRAGLDLCLTTRPDIAFVDIKMPIMDGLTMATRMKEAGLETEIVILSAYQDFQFAQEGIAIGISDYLLKHEISKASVQQLIQRLKTRVNAKREKEYFAKQSLYSAIIHRTIHDTAALPGAADAQESSLAVLIGMAAQPFALTEALRREEDPPLAVFPQAVAEPLQLDFFTSVEYRDGAQVYLFRSDTASQRHHIERLQRVAGQIMALHQGYGGREACFVLLANPVPVSWLHDAVEFGYRQLEQSMLSNLQRYTIVSFAKGQAGTSAEGPGAEACEALFRLLRKRAFEQTRAYMLSTLREALDAARLSRQHCEKLFAEIVREIDLTREEQGLPSLRHGMGLPPRLYTKDQALEWLAGEVAAMERAQRALPTIRSAKLEQAVAYIRAHCASDLVQQQVADELGFSSVYLSVLFKRELNTTFLTFLTDCRMQMAKHLLSATDKKVYEISQEVGYQTSQYFSQVFQQSEGLTPTEYRRAQRGESRT